MKFPLWYLWFLGKHYSEIRGGPRTAATSEMERFVNGFQSLTIITKRSILDVAAVLDPPLEMIPFSDKTRSCIFGHV